MTADDLAGHSEFDGDPLIVPALRGCAYRLLVDRGADRGHLFHGAAPSQTERFEGLLDVIISHTAQCMTAPPG